MVDGKRSTQAIETYKAAKLLSEALGFSYRPADELARRPVEEIVQRSLLANGLLTDRLAMTYRNYALGAVTERGKISGAAIEWTEGEGFQRGRSPITVTRCRQMLRLSTAGNAICQFLDLRAEILSEPKAGSTRKK